jgi:hypothetical protein
VPRKRSLKSSMRRQQISRSEGSLASDEPEAFAGRPGGIHYASSLLLQILFPLTVGFYSWHMTEGRKIGFR